ncbi:hypothetical protein N665_0339s0059 [Sinapis alba]|nr:hypothetical protein N665_0339s0059 [Sinapis alba]
MIFFGLGFGNICSSIGIGRLKSLKHITLEDLNVSLLDVLGCKRFPPFAGKPRNPSRFSLKAIPKTIFAVSHFPSKTVRVPLLLSLSSAADLLTAAVVADPNFTALASDYSLELPKRIFTLREEPFPIKSIAYHTYDSKLFSAVRDALHDDEYEELKESRLGVFLKFKEMDFGWASRLVHYMLCFQLNIKKKYELWSLVGADPVRFSLIEFEQLTDIDEIYAPVNFQNDHWIAIWISIPKRHIVVWDIIVKLISKAELDEIMKPFLTMVPYLLVECASTDKERIKYSLEPFTYERPTVGVPQCIAGDWGVYALKYMECHALGYTLFPPAFCEKNVKQIREKMAHDIFHETPGFEGIEDETSYFNDLDTYG